MIVLGLETATTSGGAALYDGKRLLGSIQFTTKALYSQRLMPSIEWLLARSTIDVSSIGGIAVSIGPGSFTGLRIGLSVAKALAYACQSPIVAIPTMQALALRAACPPGIPVVTLLDARHGQVYAGYYKISNNTDEPTITELHPEYVGPLEEAVAKIGGLEAYVTGDAAAKYEKQLHELSGAQLLPVAAIKMLPGPEEVAWLGHGKLSRGELDELQPMQPHYLRLAYAGSQG